MAAAQQWRNFGIDVNVVTSESIQDITFFGNYEVSTNWPAPEPWGGHPDLDRVLSPFHSRVYKPIGEYAVQNGPTSRWTNPKLDKIVENMEKIDWNDPRNLELGMEGLKLLIEEMPTIPTFGYPGVVGWDEYYWTNYPGAENPYTQPYHHWPNLKYMLPYLEPTGRK